MEHSIKSQSRKGVTRVHFYCKLVGASTNLPQVVAAQVWSDNLLAAKLIS